MRDPFEIKTSFSRAKSSRTLDWDESSASSQSPVDDIHDEDRIAPNLGFLKLLIFAAFGILTARVFYLQIIQGGYFRTLSDNNRVRSQSVLAPRGLILDRNGQTLAQNTASFNLVAVPFDLPKNQADLQAEVVKAAATFKFDPSALTAGLKNAGANSILPIVVEQDMDPNLAILFQTQASSFVGFSIDQVPVRDYIDAPIFSHVLGYTGLVSQQDLKTLDPSKYDSVDFAGKSGIEATYENYLHGQNGRDLVEVDATGKLLDILGQSNPVPGDNLELNIDKGLQEELYKDLATIKSPKAAAVALDPRNGQVLALVSLPGFNNDLFARGISSTSYSTLLNDKNLPLFNRAVAGQYPPGSTSKLMTAVAGLQTGVITDSTIINDNGDLIVPNEFGGPPAQFHGWKPGGLGPMTVRSAIALSSDIFFYQVAGGSPNGSLQGLGPDRLADYFRKFGLGKTLGIDIPGEKAGLVPDPAWKMQYFNNDPLQGKWYLGDTYHMGIGQGDLLVTPLQVAEWTAIVANNGVGYVPQIAQKAVDQNGKIIWQSQPKVLVSDIASPQVFQIVQEGMRQTVTAGTAKPLNTLPITSAGKTGTSQFDGSDPGLTHAWFTAYAPYEDPQIVITVLVEAGGEGNAVAEPVVKDALKWWAANRYKK